MVLFSFVDGFLEVAVFLLAIIAFVWAIRFFMDSRKLLNELFPGLTSPLKVLSFGIDRNGFLVPKRAEKKSRTAGNAPVYLPQKAPPGNTNKAIDELRLQLQQQQQDLTIALQKMALASGQMAAPTEKTAFPAGEQPTLKALQSQLAEKDAEIQRLRKQEAYTQKLQEQFLDVQDAFEEVREKLVQMEKQVWQAAEMSIQLEQAEQIEQKLEATLCIKEEKLRNLSLENGQLRDACHQLETKLSEAHLQQEQLMRKMHLLEGLNTDMLQMAEAARKLKNGMARAAELESMLQTISSTHSEREI